MACRGMVECAQARAQPELVDFPLGTAAHHAVVALDRTGCDPLAVLPVGLRILRMPRMARNGNLGICASVSAANRLAASPIISKRRNPVSCSFRIPHELFTGDASDVLLDGFRRVQHVPQQAELFVNAHRQAWVPPKSSAADRGCDFSRLRRD